jgi:hypothetical protein
LRLVATLITLAAVDLRASRDQVSDDPSPTHLVDVHIGQRRGLPVSR